MNGVVWVWIGLQKQEERMRERESEESEERKMISICDTMLRTELQWKNVEFVDC